MHAGTSSRWTRRFVAASACYFALWRLAALAGAPARVQVVLAVYGFACHVVFGMAYLLVPAAFGRVLTSGRPPAGHFALASTGTVALAASALGVAPRVLAAAGATAWCLGVAVFVATLARTVRGALRRAPGTAPGGDRRFGNLWLPVALAYLAVGSAELLAATTRIPGLTDGYPARVTHLVAAGFAGLLLLTFGVRYLPRFLGTTVPPVLVRVALPAGALGPAGVALGLGTRPRIFAAGAGLEAIALVGYAACCVLAAARSDRPHAAATTAVVTGALAGVAVVLLGLSFAFGTPTPGAYVAHRALALLGFLALSITGFATHFLPPATGHFRGASDRGVHATAGLLVAGLVGVAAGSVGALSVLTRAGHAVALAGALAYLAVVGRLAWRLGARHRRHDPNAT